MNEAFILLGGLWSKNPGLLTEVARRRLCPLVIDDEDRRTAGELAMAAGQPGHPLRLIREHRLLPSVGVVAVLDAVRQWSEKYHIVGLHALREEFVEAAGVCADYLGLPSPGLTATRVCRDKRLQRLYLRQWSPPSRGIRLGDGTDLTAQAYPVVVKPATKFASLGVQICADAAALATKLARHGPGEELLIEQVVHGQEISVETLVQHGQPISVGITVKQTTQPGSAYCVEVAHTLGPDLLPEPLAAAVRAVNAQVLRRLEFRDGLSHAEYMITDAGEVVLIEIAARNPGDSILPMYHLATGQPIEPAIVDIALGLPARYGPLRRYARQRYLPHPAGRLTGVQADADLGVNPVWIRHTGLRPPVRAGAAGDPAALREVLVEKCLGQELGELRSSMDRSMSILIDAPSLERLGELDHHVSKRVRVQVAARQAA